MRLKLCVANIYLESLLTIPDLLGSAVFRNLDKQISKIMKIFIAGFQCHAIGIEQNRNQNRSIDEVQNLGNESR